MFISRFKGAEHDREANPGELSCLSRECADASHQLNIHCSIALKKKEIETSESSLPACLLSRPARI